MDAQQVLATIGEPTRFRIVMLLAEGPRTVGELTSALGALQPQTTKHVQALQAVDVIRVQKLGRRRLASLNRETLGRLGAWFDGLATQTEDDRALDDYAAEVAEAEARAASGRPIGVDFTVERRVPASRDAVWRAWTDPEVAAQWWSPRHFTVVSCAIAPQSGARTELVLREADGAEYMSAGVVHEVEVGARIRFELSPLDAEGRVVFPVDVAVLLTGEAETTVQVTVLASTAVTDAAPMLAGLRAGWSQQLERLERLFAAR